MISLSDKFLRIAVFVTNGLFIASGIAMVSFGIYQNLSAKNHNFEEHASNGSVSIVVGCLDIVIGICGIVGLLMKMRLLLLLNVTFLSLSAVGNIIFLILFGVKMNRSINEMVELERHRILHSYGDNRYDHPRTITRTIDMRQKQYKCCGWSGSDDVNLFLKSPWYKDANKNVTELSQKFTLPDSCCIILEASCRNAVNVKEARNKGFVHKTDCLDLAVWEVKLALWITVSQMVFRTVMQIACCIFSVMFWLRTSFT